MENNFDIVVIGAGIIGLSTAYNLLLKDSSLKICILEKESEPAFHQTGHNSGVIHSGIYYKPGSLKAKNCIRGYKLLLEYCQQNAIPFSICGKLIIATEESELPRLNELHLRGIENGLDGCRIIDAPEIRTFEPNAAGIMAMVVPQTGIIDFKKVAASLRENIERRNCRVVLREKVTGIQRAESSVRIITDKNKYDAQLCVACAGLHADRIAMLSGADPGFRIIPFRGEYYELKNESRHLVRNLIYPVPDPAFPFLGVHFTRMIDGSVEAGPNAVLAFSREGYEKNDFDLRDVFDTLTFSGFRKLALKYSKSGIGEFRRSFSKSLFTKSLQRLIPAVTENDLVPGASGVRAQACDRDGNLSDDFLITEDEHMINVCNAPSPAATASLSIGETIAEKVLAKLN